MKQYAFTIKGHSAALEYAVKELEQNNWKQQDEAPVIVLPVPTFDPSGHIKGGGNIEDIAADKILVGGNLQNHPGCKKHKCIDLLQDPLYLSENAAITAHCAICIAMENLTVTLQDCPALVIGWGRIGKCLARLLRLLGAKVSIAARSESDRALTAALGYQAMNIHDEELDLSGYRVIFNTVPFMVLPEDKLTSCRKDCLKIDLASIRGIGGADVLWARGLPNLDAPESSGKLIAKMIRKEFET
jgi:dipicolinate synthase subunit A